MIKEHKTIHFIVVGFLWLFLALAALSSGTFAQTAKSEATDIDVVVNGFSDFEAQMPTKRDFGSLRFKGGAILSAEPRAFGGFSGMKILDQGRRLLAVSDTGIWFVGDIVRDKAGAIERLENTRIAPLYSGKGPRTGAPKYFIDAEAIVLNGDDVYVAFEAINVISKYKLDLVGLAMEPRLLPLPKSIDRASVNKGMEALAQVPDGSPLAGHLITITERGDSRKGPTFGWILNPEGPQDRTGMFMLKRDSIFDVTEAGFLKGGDLIVLERRFTIANGIAMRLRRIKGDEIKAGAVLDGEVIMEAGLVHRIDNMEAMSIYENDKGETVIALLSDDNHSLIQRTIFLEFILP